MLLFYNLSMWIGEQMLWRIPGSSLSHVLSLWLPKYDWSLITILRGGAGHVGSRRGYEASRGTRTEKLSRFPREKEFSDLTREWLRERTRITEQFSVNMGQDMNKPMQNIDGRLIINIAASLEWRISRTQEHLGDPWSHRGPKRKAMMLTCDPNFSLIKA